MACLHSPLCFVLVDWFQLVPEHHRDDRLSGFDGISGGHDVDGLGNEARQRKLDLKGNSSKMQNNVSVTGSIGRTAISQVVFLSSAWLWIQWKLGS